MSGIKWIDAKKFDLNKHKSNTSKGYVLEVNLEQKIKRRNFVQLSNKNADFYNISNGNINTYEVHYENLKLYLRLELKLKKIHCVLEFNQSEQLKPYVEFNSQKRIEVGKSGDKDRKALYKLMNCA